MEVRICLHFLLGCRMESIWYRLRVNTGNPTPSPRRYHAGVEYNGKLYVFGGSKSKDQSLDDLWSFNPVQKQWTQLAQQSKDKPCPRCSHSATVDRANGLIYIFGGLMTDGRTVVPANEFAWKYDIENDLWTRLQSTNQPPTRYNHSATVDDSGTRVLFAGGSLNNKKFYSDIWQFTFATQQWQQLSLNLPTGRAGHIMWQSLDQWFLFGGYNGDGGFNYLVDMHKVQESTLEKVGDVSANEWQVEDLKGTVPFTARPIIYQKYGDYLLVFGGYDGKGPSAELNVMDMKSARFFPVQLWLDIDPDEQIQIETVQPAINSAQVSTTGATKPTARYGHCMIILPPSSNNENESRLLVFGGGGSLYLNDLFMIEIPSKVA